MQKSLFAPFRAIGFVASSIPLSIQARGQTYFLVSALQNTFSILNGENLNLVLVGDHGDEEIRYSIFFGLISRYFYVKIDMFKELLPPIKTIPFVPSKKKSTFTRDRKL